jgi:serine/threonine-protein kinase
MAFEVEPGREFGGYVLLEELGRGGMGVVYKARQKDLDRIVAIKMIVSSHLASAEQVERFTIEARAAARLRHPRIVRIHEYGRHAGQHFFAMEYVEGPGLDRVLRGGPMGVEAAARHVAEIARAVHYLHERGIVHRDLKPSNILLDADGQPCVTDFGLVKLAGGDGARTADGAILGTPCYMAPEQAGGRDDVGPASDFYGLGAILYELLTGRPPFRAGSALDTIVQVIEGEPTPPAQLRQGLPRELELICLRCLEKNPADRYASAAALADDLGRFLAGEDVEARPSGPWQRLRRWSRREPALAARLAGLSIMLVLTQVNFARSTAPNLRLHLLATAILLTWVAASFGYQAALRAGRRPGLVTMAWLATDITLTTLLLALLQVASSAMVVVYPLLVAASGLWFQTRLVWFTTALAELGYALLVLDASRRGSLWQFDHPNVFMAALAVLGYIVAYQVKRVRALSRYYGHRPLP